VLGKLSSALLGFILAKNIEDIFNAIDTNDYSNIPQNSVLLTFDDGYIDHYTNVFPILDKYKIQGCFFPPAKAIQENLVLDVNKIHYILAAVIDKGIIINEIFKMLKKLNDKNIKEKEYYIKNYYNKSRFDTDEVTFIKMMLQKILPLDIRQAIINNLFQKYVTKDEVAFSKELYMDIEQLKCMYRNGMFIGSHGYEHWWLNTISDGEQKKEIELSLDFLKEIGTAEAWVMCYPYGQYNDSLLKILKQKGCKFGLTTEVNVADLNRNNYLTLPRLDCNDLPKERNACKNKWLLFVHNING
jgi:peptidoglycan/xylan/chitin deacetylase (PgdA/CDA1 family)